MSIELEQPVVPPQSAEASPAPFKSKTSWQHRLSSPLALISFAFAVALTMWMADFQPVSSDTTKLNVAYEPTVSDADFLNLNHPVWSADRTNKQSKETDASGQPTGKVSTTVIPLSSQYIMPQEGGSVLQMTARAIFNDKTMAVLVQWQDNTRNATNNYAKNEYSDAVALEFPVALVAGHTPFRCMGQSDSEVNIWQWKAERERVVAGDSTIVVGRNERAVKNYLGPGAGYLKAADGLEPDSTASYDEATKTWSVVFRRALQVGSAKEATQFSPAQATLIAFAIWDGGAGERLSKKAVSTWVDFIFQPGDANPQSFVNILTMGGVSLLLIVTVAIAWKVLPNPNRPARNK